MRTRQPGQGGSNEFDYPDRTTAALNTTGAAEFYINGVSGQDIQYDEETHMDIVTQKTSITYPYDINTQNVAFEFVTLIHERYTSIKINGIDYSSYIPGYTSSENPKTDAQIEEEVLAAIDFNGNSQTTSTVIPDVPRADSYTIEVSRKDITTEDSVYWLVGNFLWSYLETDAGSAVLPSGAELTVALIPEYGYQLISFGINGGTFETGDEVGVYTFTIPRGNFHLGAHFAQI